MSEEEAGMAQQRVKVLRRQRIFNRAVWRKSSRFTTSGLVTLGIGVVLIAIGASLNTGPYSSEGLLIGVGAIIVLVGIVRLLIGFINPAIPEDLQPPAEPEEVVTHTDTLPGEPEDDSV